MNLLGDSTWYCRNYFRSFHGLHRVYEMKLCCDLHELETGNFDFVRFAVCFPVLNRENYQMEAIGKMIFVDPNNIERVDAFADIDDFVTYRNFDSGYFDSDQEEEECFR